MSRYVLNKCKVPVSEGTRLKEPPGLRECHNPKAWSKHSWDGALRRPGG
ncbi:MAG: hypothetical protein ACFFAL_06560 [Promethearchaeota archaeon]